VKINTKEIKPRRYALCFGVLPLILLITASYFVITSDIGFWSILYYIPVWINLIIGWFFKPEKHKTLLEKIPEKVKLGFLVVCLILMMVVAPIFGVLSIVNVDFNPQHWYEMPIFSIETDLSLLILGIIFIVASLFFWAIFIYATEIYQSIGFWLRHYGTFVVLIFVALVTLYKFFETADLLYLIISFILGVMSGSFIMRREHLWI